MFISILLLLIHEILIIKCVCPITTTLKISKGFIIFGRTLTSTKLPYIEINCPNGEVPLITTLLSANCYPCINGVCINGTCTQCRCPPGYSWDEENKYCHSCDDICHQDGYEFGLNCFCQKQCKLGEIYSWLNKDCYSCGQGGWCDGNGFCHQCTCPVGEYYDPYYLACLPCKWQFGNECKYYGLNCACSETSLFATTTLH
jgi:hypothetical protein